jgi:hypothetical protein
MYQQNTTSKEDKQAGRDIFLKYETLINISIA